MALARLAPKTGQKLARDWTHLKSRSLPCLVVDASCQLEQLALSLSVFSLTWQLHGRHISYWRFRVPKIHDPRENDRDSDRGRGKERG